FVLAGVMLQATAVGHPIDDGDHDLYSGLFRELRQAPERLDALWTGMRHGFCRQERRRDPYLLVYWREHVSWTSDDPRRVARVADAIAQLFADCQLVLNMSLGEERAFRDTADMMADLYRDLAIYLGPLAKRERSERHGARIADMPLMLLDAVHTSVMRTWPSATSGAKGRVAVINSYEERRTQLSGTPPVAQTALVG
ncbi:MAG TPA: hypothetical protein VFW76_04750, partial [Ktedonobacterales bacterium]|nr:hypothetical protein [Ktedonobacterales bacterium]